MPAPSDAQLSASAPRVFICAYLDILDDPVWAALAPLSVVTPASTILPAPDPDFDNRTFTALDPRFVSVTPVVHGPGGMEAVEYRIAGTLAADSAYLTALSNPARFRGRPAKLWLGVFNDSWQPVAARPFSVGYMTTPKFVIAPDEQAISIISENYMALIGSGAPSRTLLWSPDPADQAAAATTGAVNSTAALGPSWAGGAPAKSDFFPVDLY
jgi:hypothetical protein